MTHKMQEQALEWLLRLEEDQSFDTRKAFVGWCEQSRDHVHAFLEVTVLDRELNTLDTETSVDIQALIEECRQSPASVAIASILPQEKRPEAMVSRSAKIWRRATWAAAASVVLGAVGVTVFTVQSSASLYRTQTGEQRSVKLADGSMVYLNTRSRIKVDYSNEVRRIDLLEGEAFFVAARDSARPMRVFAGDTMVQVLGTQFNVYRENTRTTVSVVEGKVQVTTGAQPVPLEAGEAAQVLGNRRVVRKDTADVAHATAWRQRRLDFRRATLFEVAAEFNRYNTLQIRIADPDVGERQLNGVFDADMPGQLLKFLEQRQDLRFERTDNAVVIRARE